MSGHGNSADSQGKDPTNAARSNNKDTLELEDGKNSPRDKKPSIKHLESSPHLLYYSDNAIATSSSEDDLSPFSSNNTNASLGPTSNSAQDIDKLVLNENSFKNQSHHKEHNSQSRPNDDLINPKDTTNSLHAIPEFNKRPLSDTPITSSNASPALSNVNSTVVSREGSPEFKAVTLQEVPGEVEAESVIPQLRLSKRRGTAIDLPGVTKPLKSPTSQLKESLLQLKSQQAATTTTTTHMGSKLVVVMVGLPASGKSYISNKLTRYMNWLQHYTRIFNVGETRRKDDKDAGPGSVPLVDPATSQTNTPPHYHHEHNTTSHDASFFNPSNAKANETRERWAMDTLDTLLEYLSSDKGSIGVFDATNSTKARRKKILQRIRAQSSEVKVLFLESICSDKVLIAKNVKLKLTGPDYRDMDPDLALRDFQQRLSNYEKAYEPIDDSEGLQYVKMIDVGKKVVAYDIQGFLASQVVFYLLNFNLNERQIWIARHGESEDNVAGKIGGDSKLTARGEKFAKALYRFIDHQRSQFWEDQERKYASQLLKGEIDQIPLEPNFNVWTSMLERSISTAVEFSQDPNQNFDVKEIRMLNELCAGEYEGLTYEQIQQSHPDQFSARLKDKLHYRYPGIGGESYLDVLNRVRPIINEVERTTDHVLLITHRVVARVLLGYFMNLHRDHIVNLDIPLHCVYLLEPKPYGVEWTMFEYDETKDWFFKVEKEDMHHKKVKESGLSFRERRYSVVPTAPSTGTGGGSRGSMGRSKGSVLELQEMGFMTNSRGPLESIQRARGPPVSTASATTSTVPSGATVNIDSLADRLSKLKR
ncbi:hypothetical protein WICPIJ_002654 [Wickerhamomyces pijperi]|uniref:6-phosphofructo-2-kinase domain-containing protein n=1 Tax=Wickerhamomyces pijperi TaxID=599730 RepID=A0A9P8Q995_WICPI|nr:hypothetical protein WICPIJ_002654 [Wickerhamomyces pijperi]